MKAKRKGITKKTKRYRLSETVGEKRDKIRVRLEWVGDS